MNRPSAFTLIELLVVVAIIAILVAIAVPNMLEAQVRSKVARIQADQRTMATAIESYCVDHNKYPVRRDAWEGGTNPLAAPPFNEKIYDPDAGQQSARVGLHVLTTPVSYISVIPPDVFNSPAKAMAQPGNPYSDAIDYWDVIQTDSFIAGFNAIPLRSYRNRGRSYMLISVGPDQRMGLLNGNPGDYPPDTLQTNYSCRMIYDASNGTISVGNVYRFSAGYGQPDLFPVR